MAETDSATQSELARLGAGGSGDRLRFRLVLKLLFRCVPLLKHVKWHLCGLALACLALAALVLPSGALLLDVFFTRVLKGDAPTAFECRSVMTLLHASCTPWDDAARRAALRGLVGFTVALSVVGGAGGAAIYYYRLFVLQRVNQLLRMRLHDRLSALSLRFHNDSAVGDGIYRMFQDSSVVTQLIDMLFLMPPFYLGLNAVMSGLIALYEPKLLLGMGAGWCVALAIGWRYSRRLRVGFRSAREHNSALTSTIQASMQGARVIKAYGAERAEQRRFEQLSQAAFAAAYTARSRLLRYSMLVFFAFAVPAVGAIAWGSMLAANSAGLYAKATLLFFGFTVWNIGLWNNFRGRLGNSVLGSYRLFELWGRMQDTAIGLDRVFELLDLEPEVKDAPDAIDMPAFQTGIEWSGVSFAYAKGKPTLSDVQVSAAAGTITAIVGPTGSGKSTLMSLLLRLYDPDAGAIRIDGRDLRALKLDSLRANVAIALQENLLFGTTIRENIRYAVPDASDAAVREAARVAAADEFIDRLPLGYDTPLGERGTKLSTGQRQRLSIARALLKDAPILILDEPTAALDAQTEMRVLDNLASWRRGRAVFLITHRLSTIRRADQVVFIEDGRVVEHGTHERLMATAGSAYRRLVEGEQAAARAQPRMAVS